MSLYPVLKHQAIFGSPFGTLFLGYPRLEGAINMICSKNKGRICFCQQEKDWTKPSALTPRR
ncbi:MAG: hypothetical protein D3911_12245 [Candidatus Electrothrix sp. AW3_4]|nr:hypothetical protein [Candidatus Electrothrix gigas]